jgi:integrase
MTGRLYRRSFLSSDGTRRRASTWTLRYYNPLTGRRVEESTGTNDRRQAAALLRKRLVEIDEGRAPIASRTTLADLERFVVTDYEQHRRHTTDLVRAYFRRLAAFFGARTRAVEIDEGRIAEYRTRRLSEGAAPATVNREMALLRRAFRLAYRARRVPRVPHFEQLREDNVRKGFFERPDFEAVVGRLPAELRELARVLYITGWRRDEVLTRQWGRHVDLGAGWMRLEPGETKNGRGRQVPIVGELREALEAQRAYTTDVERTAGAIVPWVFHRQGRPVRDFRDAWLRACREAGVGPRLVHDFRRTAARNLIRAGVSQSVAMAMLGHETDSVFRRYAIVDEGMLGEAGERLARFLEAQPREQRVAPLPPKLPPNKVEKGVSEKVGAKGAVPSKLLVKKG